MKILFSPIGMTDPIRFFKDGALLNITRHYKPDMIYLYMSKEVLNYHKKDNRYILSLKYLSELIGKNFDVKIIERPELEDVQIFDFFIDEFRSLLNDIHTECPDSEIILNVSSGTPAMKSSLQILSLTLDFPCLPVQVSTPQKSSNPRIDEESSLSPEEHWELNESNDTDDNRCLASVTKNLLGEFQKQTVIKMIRSYNYTAAYDLCSASGLFSGEFKEMVSAACSRLKLEYSKTRTVFRKHGFISTPPMNTENEELTEYLLLLKIKVIKEEYADFLRAITPVSVKLLEIYLKANCGIDLDDYTIADKKNGRLWSRDKMAGTEALKILDKCYQGHLTDKSPIYSNALEKLIAELSSDHKAAACASNLIKSEKNARNLAAHTIIPVTDKMIFDKTGFKAKEILDMIFAMYHYCRIKVDADAYDKMNDFICSFIEKQEIPQK